MKNLYLFIFVIAAALVACKSNTSDSETSSESTKTEETSTSSQSTTSSQQMTSTTKKNPDVIHRTYTQRHETVKPKKKSKPAAKTVANKKVIVFHDEPIVHHDHEPVKVAELPAEKKPVDTKGYHYLAPHWASFPGGEAALDKFLADNLRYPERALDAGVEGTVYTELYVDEFGEVVDFEFPAKKLGYGLEDEVERVIKLMPRWEPGMYDNAKVKSKFVLPVRFDIQ